MKGYFLKYGLGTMRVGYKKPIVAELIIDCKFVSFETKVYPGFYSIGNKEGWKRSPQ